MGAGDSYPKAVRSLVDAAISANLDSYLAYGRYIEAATLVCLVRSNVEGSGDAIGSLQSAIGR
jgi:hypothetical protein